jgi:hypothetical protein
MKKPLCALLALLFLTACAPAPPAPELTPVASPSPSSIVNSFFPDVDALPPLEPFTFGEKYTQYYPETPREFFPRADYGEIFPYIGGELWVTTDGYRYRLDYLYGFCTADGKILCEPVFTGVYTYQYGGGVYYVCRRTAAFYAWETPPTAADLNVYYLIPSDGGAIDAYADYYAFPRDSPYKNGVAIQYENDRYAAVREDGTAVIPFRGDYIEHRGDFLKTQSASPEGRLTQFYDLDGNLALESTAFLDYLGGGWFFRQTGEKRGALYRDGKAYASFPFRDGDAVSRLTDDRFLLHPQGENPYIIDGAGAVVFDFDSYGDSFATAGTWEDTRRLHVGLFDGNRYVVGLTDENGEELIPPEFDRLEPVNGNYLARRGVYGGLVDENGDWIVRVSLLDSMND